MYSLGVPSLHLLGEVLQLVLAQRSIALQREPLQRAPTCRQLGTKTIAVLDIACNSLADVALCTSHYKLVDVSHIIKVGAGIPVGAAILIAQLCIKQMLCLRKRCAAVVGEVVALRFAVGVGY